MNSVDAIELPSVSKYVKALRASEPRLSQLQRALLVAHFKQPNLTVSAKKLANAVGYQDSSIVNLHYGRLGTLLRETLGFREKGQQSYAIASFIKPRTVGNQHWLWTMHKPLASALKELKWTSGRDRVLHIVQGGITNGDKLWLEQASAANLTTDRWIVPMTAGVGDDVVVYVGSFGFFATARITTTPRPRKGWQNRYGAGLDSIKLIRPSISLGLIRKRIPELTWANYPRSVTTPAASVADKVWELIEESPRTRLMEFDEDLIDQANIEELKGLALLDSRAIVDPKKRIVMERRRSRAIRRYVLLRANGNCEGCDDRAPFFSLPDGSPYLEEHHVTGLAKKGPDHLANAIALCPNCHRRAEYSIDREKFNRVLAKRLAKLEPFS